MKNQMFYTAAVMFCLSALPAQAQEADVLAPTPAPIEAASGAGHFKDMTPEERKAFAEQHRGQLQNMTAEEKEALKAERKAKFQNMSPEQKEQLKAALRERKDGRGFKGQATQ